MLKFSLLPICSVTMFTIRLSDYLTVLFPAMQLTLIPLLFSHLFPQKDMCSGGVLFWYLKSNMCAHTHMHTLLHGQVRMKWAVWLEQRLFCSVLVGGHWGGSHGLASVKGLTPVIAETLTVSKDGVLPSLAIGFLQSDFKREMPYWLLKILTACLIACDLSTERGRTGCLMTLPNDGYFPSLYLLPVLLFSGPTSQDQLTWWAHIFVSHYFCYTGDTLVIWQEHRDLQRHVSKWLVWIFMTADKV